MKTRSENDTRSAVRARRRDYGNLVARLGATETVQFITSDVRLPNGIDPATGELWRRRLAPRSNPGQIHRILADMERDDLRLLTPADVEWPSEQQQLGTSAPIALRRKGDPGHLSIPLPGHPFSPVPEPVWPGESPADAVAYIVSGVRDEDLVASRMGL
ncbi:hypothetical protein [Cryobacterium gelidum]|uniref:Uncharacterized protein n=1 Tax=Cryobacterium gelidum TaxID=1259164 RepID=A0A4R9AYS6_9MICO|nr:hypothetical protein [Cryobacterium gelidum]TFD72890.1 hypothetical protein E3T50_04065 [Cryobacterium gelidum]